MLMLAITVAVDIKGCLANLHVKHVNFPFTLELSSDIKKFHVYIIFLILKYCYTKTTCLISFNLQNLTRTLLAF